MQRIAYFGPSGTFTEAALAQFELEEADLGTVERGDVERVAALSPAAALESVREGSVVMACVPYESSVDGPVAPTLDALATGMPLQILAETELDIAFAILARPDTPPARVRSIGAYPVAAAQVRESLQQRFPEAEVFPAASNAGAAEDVAAGKVDAAVSTTIAGRRLGLALLAEDVADVPGARTRFVLVGRPQPAPARTGSDRTAVVLDLPNDPGALSSAMLEFAVRGIDLTSIRSRPTRTGIGTYRFYIDCCGHVEDTVVAEALKALHRRCTDVRYLGSWPAKTYAGCPPPADAAESGWLEGLKSGRRDG